MASLSITAALQWTGEFTSRIKPSVYLYVYLERDRRGDSVNNKILSTSERAAHLKTTQNMEEL